MLISVIIPCYNVSEYIVDCLNSVFCQTYTEIEIITIDNNSTDKTFSLLKYYKDSVNESLIIAKEQKEGAPAARNTGLALASGQWIQFLDADDLLKPKKIEHQIKILKKIPDNQNTPFIAAAYNVQELDGTINSHHLKKDDVFKILFTGKLGVTSSNLFNKSFLLKVGGWNEALKSSQEAELMFRILQLNDNILIDNKPFTIKRIRSSGQISSGSLDNQVRHIELRLQMLDFLKYHRKEMYIKTQKALFDYLLQGIKNISKTDLQKGNYYYESVIPKDYVLSESVFNRSMRTLIKFIGYINAMKLRQFLKT